MYVQIYVPQRGVQEFDGNRLPLLCNCSVHLRERRGSDGQALNAPEELRAGLAEGCHQDGLHE